jgi:transmembrane protein 231
MPFEVHREALSKRHYAPFMSSTCFYMAFFFVILIFLPLIIAYNSYDFWWKQAYILEQPAASYRYVTVLQWSGYNSDTMQPISFYYSTSPFLNSLFSSNLRTPVFRSAELDENSDGRTDRLEISAQLPVSSNEKITGLSSLIYFDVKLNSIAKYLTDSVLFVSFESGSAMANLQVEGDMKIRQTWPLSSYGGYKTPYQNDPLFPSFTFGSSASEFYIENIMRKNNARNLSFVFQPTLQYVSQRAGQGQTFTNSSIIIRIPQQPIVYTPPLSAVLKFAWIQYMSFFIVVAFLLYQINSFVFENKLLPTYAAYDIIEPDHKKNR